MRIWIKKYPVQITQLVIMILMTWIIANLYWGDGRWFNIIKDDGCGYYAYLPAVFIYQDLSFGFTDEFKKDSIETSQAYEYRSSYKGLKINKYFIGTALVQAPFYLVGHIVNYIAGLPLDGYGEYYLIMFSVGTLFYLLAGLRLLHLILRIYHIREGIIAFLILAVVLGTNLLYYVIGEPSMSHVYSFAFVNLFVYASLNYFKERKTISFLLGVLAFSLVVLIRPVNGMVILSLPFLAGSFSELRNGVKHIFSKPWILLAGILFFLALTSLQLITYKLQTGHYLIYSYQEEGFLFLSPHFLDFLISYKKGFFVYTPMAFLALFGIIYIWRQSRFQAISLVLFLAAVVYVFSSWWMWYYGGSFSQRVMVEYLVFFLIPMGFLLMEVPVKKLFYLLIGLFILINITQVYQYRYGYLHWSDMNKELYWDNFLRIDKVINKAPKEW